MSELDLSTPYATWVYLNRVVEGPSAALQALLTQYPAEEIAHGIYNRADWIGPLWRARPPAMTGCGKPKTWRLPKKSGPGSLRQKAQSGPQRSSTLHSAFISTAGKPQLLLMTKHCHRIACGCAVRHCRQRLLKLWPSSVLVPFPAMAGRPPKTSCPDWFSMNGLQYQAARWEWIPSRTKQRCTTTDAQ